MKSNILYAFCLAFYLLLVSCALQIPPTGGAKDLKAPKVVRTTPENGTINFKENKIQLYFDEFVELNEAQKEIIITPPLPHPAAYSIKRKPVIIDFKNNQLKENTTYTIIMGNSIKDLHEGNKLEHYEFVFSTGSYLDSASIEGKSSDALRNNPMEKVKILLYKDSGDSMIYKQKPDYYAITDKDGNFKLKHLQKRDYTIFALNDKNDNLQYDPGEEIGFSSTRIDSKEISGVKDTSLKTKSVEAGLNLKMFLPIREQSVLKNYTFSPPKITFKLGKIPEQLLLSKSKSLDKVYWKALKYNDSIAAWIPSKADTAKLPLSIKMDTVAIDTVLTGKALAKGAFKLQIKAEGSAANMSLYNMPISLQFTIPVLAVNKNLIDIRPPKSKSSTLKSWRFADSSHTVLLLDAELDPDTATAIKIKPGAFQTIYGDRNESAKFSVNAIQQRNYGHLSVILKLPESRTQFIFQLVNKDDGKVYYEKPLTSSATIDLPFVDPGTYKMRLIADLNHNGRWDTGDFMKHILAEDVYYYSEDLVIKANWELLDVKFGVGN